MSESYPELLVLGAGPCGLAAAYHAARQGLQVQLIDAAARPGGRMQSTVEDWEGAPLVIEHGPVGWMGDAPETTAACQALGLEPLESSAADSHRYLVHEGRLLPFPQRAGALARSKVLSLGERLRASAEKWADFAEDGKEETVDEFFTRRFGAGFAQKLVAPVVRALFAEDSRTASLPALLPQLAEAELRYGSLTKALLRNPGVLGSPVHSLPRGTGQLAEALGADLLPSMLLSTRVDSAVREQGWWFLFCEGQQVAVGRQLAVCLPPRQTGLVLREYLGGGPERIARSIGPDLATVAVLARADELPDPCAGFGILPPAENPGSILSVQFHHAIFPEHVPEGWVLLRGMLGGDADPEILQRSDDELVDKLTTSLEQWLGFPRRPARSWVFRIPGGVPHYGLGHAAETQGLLHDLGQIGGLHLGGDAWFGIGIEAALLRGAEVARAAQESGPA